MIDEPAVERFLVDVVVNSCVVQHHDRHFCWIAFLRGLIEKLHDSRTLDGFLVQLVAGYFGG